MTSDICLKAEIIINQLLDQQEQGDLLPNDLVLSQPTVEQQHNSDHESSSIPRQSHVRYRNPTYTEYDARVATFLRWPSDIVQTPQQLAEAGFFYTGDEDIVRCYACDGGLGKWQSDEEPWIEHGLSFPHCIHVIHERGQEYIDLIQVMSEKMKDLKVNNSTGRESKDPIYSLSRAAVDLAMQECSEKNIGWSAEDLVNLLLEKQDKREVLPTDSPRAQSPVLLQKVDECDIVAANENLKRKLKCILCEEKDVNVLFLPCTHHTMCMTCARGVTMCPLCERTVNEKIRTYMS